MITMDWGDSDRTLLVIRCDGRWLPYDVRRMQQRLNGFMCSTSDVVDILIDTRSALASVEAMQAVWNSLLSQSMPGGGEIIVINKADLYLRIYQDMQADLPNGRALHFMTSVDEAYIYAGQIREQRHIHKAMPRFASPPNTQLDYSFR